MLWIAAALASDGDALLARMDAAANRGQDAHLVLDVTVVDRAGTRSEPRTLEIWQKGSDRRLVRFTAPARLAGTSLLTPDGDTVYLYLPAYGKPRRVIGDQRGDAFMGTDFSLEDLSRLSFADEYTATVEADEGDVTRLKLLPKDPKAHRDAALRVWMREGDDLLAKVEYLSADGSVRRRLTLSDFKAADGRVLAHRLVAEDLANQKRTEATVRAVDMDSGLSDGLFALTELSKP
ncbi:MAG: outer membrane lipoprotein-sorting protein [Myxococcota bacterium]